MSSPFEGGICHAQNSTMYESGLKILTVGDGDLSYSLSMAQLVGGSMLTATSYEPLEIVRCTIHEQISNSENCSSMVCYSSSRSTYRITDQTVMDLRKLGAQVLFGIDATKLHSYIPGWQIYFRSILSGSLSLYSSS
jgi:hypothetical protein